MRLIDHAAANADSAAVAQARAEAEAQTEAARVAAEGEAQERAKAAAEAQASAAAEAARAKAEAAAAKQAREAEARRKAAERARAEEARRAQAAKAAAAAKAQADAKARAKAAAEQARRDAAEQARREDAARRAVKEQARLEAETTAEAARAAAEAQAHEQEQEQEQAGPEAAPHQPPPTPPADLAATFRRLIRETGPISLAQFMAESNARYYITRDPLGAEGDFITAPEVSQMFGELVGLWLADLWVRMGSRKHIHYVELGPGRGTLAKDALGAGERYGFAPQVHFVETSPALRKLQSAAFPDCRHHHDLSTLPTDAPLLIVANEFLDALPIQQLVRAAEGWRERLIGLNRDELVFVVGDTPVDNIVPPSWRKAPQGTLIETSRASIAVVAEISMRLKEQGGAALIIDYGASELSAGSTLQALKAHQKVDPLTFPGEADLTAHVDFELLQQVAPRYGAEVMGLQTQGDWLRQLGIDTRLEALIRRNPADAPRLKRQYQRLVDDDQMGVLFKVLGLTGRRWPIGVGFE